tara:strand:+ start:318 stop:608 length:291 start_codon:yes stop_codon:yes gene_type:complete
MIAKIIYYCKMVRWFIVGGRKPVNLIKTTQSKTDKKVYNNWSKAEYQMHFRNAASNLGMLHEARELWNKKPIEYRRKKEKQWEERYGKNWRKYVVI